MTPLDPAAREHLCKLLGLLGSAHDGEIAAAGLKAHQFVNEHGLSWHDAIAVQPSAQAMPPWRTMLHTCLDAHAALNSKEIEFLHTLRTWRGTPMQKQMAWLVQIYEALP
jgi:hypothetical protein